MKEEIRPLYSELQGCLKSLSHLSENSVIKTAQDWDNFNKTIDELIELTGEDYTRFKLKPSIPAQNAFGQAAFIKVNNFKIQASNLISRIYGKYFADEKNPLDGSPSTIINATQHQNQSVQIEIIMEVTELISRKIEQHDEGTPERTFLEQVKEGLKTSKGIVQLIDLILSTASKLGLTTATILQLLSR